jgi:hypothetical protein
MIEDMNARKLCAGTQRGHISSCKRFAAFVKRSPDTATLEDIRQRRFHDIPQEMCFLIISTWLIDIQESKVMRQRSSSGCTHS